MTESLNERGIGITGDDKLLIFELLPLLLKHWLSQIVFYEELNDY